MVDLSDRAAGFIKYFEDGEKRTLKKGFQNLDGVTELNRLLDSPSDSYPVIHIAGSKGKGSTAHLISGMLQSAGYRVGLFTSPHILDIRERIKINNHIIDLQDYQDLIEEVSLLINPDKLKKNPSFFDLFTLIALLYFKKEKCDFAVIETGLGGLFDSTNIVNPALSLITSLELEHRGLLGDTLEEIAAHKCGIIKGGIPVLTGINDPFLLSIIQERANEKGSPLYYVSHHMKLKKSRTGLQGTELILEEGGEDILLWSPLIGNRQIENILLAILAVKTLIPTIAYADLAKGLEQTRLDGRFEIKSYNPPVIHDVAHTGRSVRTTMEVLEQEGFTRGCLIFGCCADKELDLIAASLCPSLKDIFITTFEHVRCGAAETIYQEFQSQFKEKKVHIEIRPEAREIYKEVLQNRERYDYILVMGSFFLLSQIEDRDQP
jgi:dihydrofolate synthase/folylpolyglutamate synthase